MSLAQLSNLNLNNVETVLSQNVGFGTFTANGNTEVTELNTAVLPNSIILITMKTPLGTAAGGPVVITAISNGDFKIKSVNNDTSVYNYLVLNPKF